MNPITILAVVAMTQSGSVKCPVTKLSIPKAAAVGKASFKGKTYYFCTGHCQSLFKKKPLKYAK